MLTNRAAEYRRVADGATVEISTSAPAPSRSDRVERAYDKRPVVLRGLQLVLLVVAACLLASLMAGAVLVGLLLQLGSLGH